MGLKCKIHKDSNDNIDWVESPTGGRSNLFDVLHNKLGNKEEALKFLALSYTQEFEDWSTKALNSREPSSKDIFDFYRHSIYKDNKLTSRDLSDVMTTMTSLDIFNLPIFLDKLKTAFLVDGLFTINRDNISKSELYSELEIDMILDSTIIQDSIDSFIGTLEANIDSIDSISIPKDISYFLQNSGRITKLGMEEKVFNTKLYHKANDKLSNVNSEYQMGNILLQHFTNTNLVDKFFTNKQFAKDLFNYYNKAAKVPVYLIENGKLRPKVLQEDVDTLSQVLYTVGYYKNTVEDIELFEQIGENLYEENIDKASDLLKSIESKLVTFNIDAIGLSKVYLDNSYKEVNSFLQTTKDFLGKLIYNKLSEQDLSNYVNTKAKFLGEESTQTFEITSNKEVGKKSILKLNTELNPIELFTQFSLIKLDKQLYQKVNTTKSYSELLDIVITNASKGIETLPKDSFYPTAFNSKEVFSISKVKDVNNHKNIARDITRFIDKRVSDLSEFFTNDIDLLRKYVLTKYLVNSPANEFSSFSEELFESKYEAFRGDSNYLTTEFVSDFYKKILKQKALNTYMFNNFYKFFKIDSSGINISVENEFVFSKMSILKPNDSLTKHLKQYSLINRNTNLGNIFKIPTYNSLDKQTFKKNLYINNPFILDEYKGEVNVLGDSLTTEFTTKHFIRVSGKLYELVGNDGQNSFFIRIFENQNSNFYTFDNKLLPVKQLSKIKTTETTESVTFSNLYSTKEGKIIDKKINNCDG